MTDTSDQLEQARKSLLDMTLRNKLLSFKEYKRSTAKVVDEIPAEVYNILVFNQTSMNFLPGDAHPEANDLDVVSADEAIQTIKDGPEQCLLCEEDGTSFTDRDSIIDHLEANHGVTLDEQDNGPTEMADMWEIPELETEAEGRHVDTNLQTPHDESNLQTRLYNINNRAEALIEDAGYNALHLAVGFLEWTEAEAHEDPNRAPLILIPVQLNREGAQSVFELSWTGEEVTGNLSLELKLSEQGFELPDLERPESKADVRGYLETVEAKVAELSGWEVVPDIHLGFFDYTKFVMYQDLDPEGWGAGRGPADHELIRALLDPDESTSEPEPFDEDDIDEKLGAKEVHHVMDADPSQIAAIEDVKRGRNMVIEGPPGTGKSQTIVNMIAELLAEDKTVLFVSEKLAALDVVKERLEAANIGDFALELHSDKASKSEFLDELERLAKVGEYSADIPNETYQQIEQYQRDLNAYATALGTPYGSLERTPYDLIGRKEEAVRHFEVKNQKLPRTQFDDPKEITPEDHQAALSALRKLRSQLHSVEPVQQHPWRGCHPGQVLPQDREDIEQAVHQTLETLQELQIRKAVLEDDYSVRGSATLTELDLALEAAELLDRGETVDAELLRSSVWNERPQSADDLIELLERVQALEAGVGSRTEPSHIGSEIPELLTQYRQYKDSLTRFIRPNWYSLKGSLSTLFDGELPDDSESIIQDLEELIELQEKRAELEEGKDQARELFGSFWRGAGSEPERLRDFSNWIVQFRQQMINDVLEAEAVDYLAQGPSEDSLSHDIEEVREVMTSFEEEFTSLERLLEPAEEVVLGRPVEESPFDDITALLERWQSSIRRLDQWTRFDQTRTEVAETVAAPMLDSVNAGDLAPEDVIPCFEGCLADSLLVAAFGERDAIAQFDPNVHEDRISKFQELDRETLQLNRQRVLKGLVNGTPQMMRGSSKSSQAGTLMHEFGKQRMHKPIRVLMEEAGELIQQLKPCFMMSPLSVAKYLDPESIDFDIVIFDEASQVRPADALGTIMRGDQAVLFGDTKQLPPTSFFDQVVDHRESEDQWEFNVQDVESVLDLARSSFPSKRLKWHYRSRHESLIAVSNQEFYNNELLIYPSPVQNAAELGLKLTHLPDTTYDRGGSSVNRGEARAVAEAAVEHYRESPSKSLGIGTFSTAQQEAVREEVERLRRESQEIDEYFSRDREEHFFVKNLERIQGDERDVIFISVGYGYDADGGFSHNFGPLNHTGGWRRLNVLITRARERCEVFSNFTADAMDMSATDARGVKSLKVFLEYAETRNLDSLTEVGEDPDSPFERSVIKYLEEQGYEVHPQVGCAGFRIDLSIPDPENPGRYVLGIECDGAAYHSTPVARARDRQREAILEDRGWEIHRIWSTDWYRNRAATQERLVSVIDNAIERGALTIASEEGSSGSGSGDQVAGGGDDDVVSLEELQDETGPSLDDLAEEYETASGLRQIPLSDYSVGQTTTAVQLIVREEGPIHREVLERRIVEHSDVERRGEKVKLTLEKGISNAVQRGDISREGEFFYPPQFGDIAPRKRTDEAADIEWVAEEEIEAAIEEILEYQYATAREELISQAARVLGFERTGQRISERIGSVIEQMETAGELKQTEGQLASSD